MSIFEEHTRIARELVALGWPAVESRFDELVYWMGDGNCPAHGIITRFLKSIGPSVTPYFRSVLDSGSKDSRHALIMALREFPRDMILDLEPQLEEITKTMDTSGWTDLSAIEILLRNEVGNRPALRRLLVQKRIEESDGSRIEEIERILEEFPEGNST